MDTKNLISVKEASKILGFKSNLLISRYIDENILNSHEIEGSNRKWIDLEELLKLPKPLGIPPQDKYFQKLKANEHWK